MSRSRERTHDIEIPYTLVKKDMTFVILIASNIVLLAISITIAPILTILNFLNFNVAYKNNNKNTFICINLLYFYLYYHTIDNIYSFYALVENFQYLLLVINTIYLLL